MTKLFTSRHRQKWSGTLVGSLVSVSHHCACLVNLVTQHFCFLSDKNPPQQHLFVVSRDTVEKQDWYHHRTYLFFRAVLLSTLKSRHKTRQQKAFFKGTSGDPFTEINAISFSASGPQKKNLVVVLTQMFKMLIWSQYGKKSTSPPPNWSLHLF